MDSRQEILDAIEILIQKAIEDNVTQIQNATIVSLQGNNKCTAMVNGREMAGIQYYGGVPMQNKTYRVFIPNGNASRSFIIVPGGGSSGGSTSVKVGTVTKLPSGSNPTVTNVGTDNDVVLNFGLVDGYTPVKGVDYNDGEKGDPGQNGTDGVSCTHRWVSTRLYVTSASGTTSANLKGATGSAGSNGVGSLLLTTDFDINQETNDSVQGIDIFSDLSEAEQSSLDYIGTNGGTITMLDVSKNIYTLSFVSYIQGDGFNSTFAMLYKTTWA